MLLGQNHGKSSNGGEIICLDCTSQEGRTDHVFLSFQEKHIFKTKFLNIFAFEDKFSVFKQTVPSLQQFAEKMKELNVGLGDTVVCYEHTLPRGQPPKWACRAAWIMQLYGHKNVFILDGGFNAWLEEDRQTYNKAGDQDAEQIDGALKSFDYYKDDNKIKTLD